MKEQFFHTKMFLLASVITTAVSSHAQQHFTQTCIATGTAANRACNSACTVIHTPQLNGQAILLATKLSGDANSGDLGVWYVKMGQDSFWNVNNQDAKTMLDGSTFNVEYYANPDPNYEFVYQVNPSGTTQLIYNSYIDHINLNGNPNAVIRYMARGNGTNMYPIRFQYDAAAGKWYISNINGKAFDGKASYNIVIGPGNAFGKSNIPVDTVHKKNIPLSTDTIPVGSIISNPSPCNCVIPTSLPPNGNAGGDLDGTYPSPTVVKIMGRSLSNITPNIGQVLKWTGKQWAPANDSSYSTTNNNTGSGWSLSGNNVFNVNAGNIGIGTNTPQYKLDVNGSMRFGNATYYIGFDPSTGHFEWRNVALFIPDHQQIIGHSASAEGLYYDNANGAGRLEYRGLTDPVFFTDWITGNGYFSGNLGVGTTTPSAKLDVAGDIRATGMITPSDARFKKDIYPLQNSLQKILALKGFTYNWRTDEFTDKGFDNNQQIGFIAQQVEQVLPQLVHTGTDGYKGVDYLKLIPVMVEAIKEQQKQIDELKETVAQLLKR